jgi:thioredoxin reductase (NADPH)
MTGIATHRLETLDPDAFEGSRLRRAGRWAVVFDAEWCPFCQAFLPVFSGASMDPSIHRARADLTDVESPLWDLFRVEVVPSVLAFRDGEVVARADGRQGEGLEETDLAPIRESLRAGGRGSASGKRARP